MDDMTSKLILPLRKFIYDYNQKDSFGFHVVKDGNYIRVRCDHQFFTGFFLSALLGWCVDHHLGFYVDSDFSDLKITIFSE